MGESFGYGRDQVAVGTTNGAGPHNVQIFVLAPDGIVLHALTGFWHPEDLAAELRFARRLYTLWRTPFLPAPIKRAVCTVWQLVEAHRQGPGRRARSDWQGFDRKNELERFTRGPRDTFVLGADGRVVRDRRGQPRLKTTSQVVHERMARRPFVPYEAFDIATFSDYGRRFYDNNRGVSGKGITFMTPPRVEKKRREEEKKARRRAEREARLAAAEARRQEARERRRLAEVRRQERLAAQKEERRLRREAQREARVARLEAQKQQRLEQRRRAAEQRAKSKKRCHDRTPPPAKPKKDLEKDIVT